MLQEEYTTIALYFSTPYWDTTSSLLFRKLTSTANQQIQVVASYPRQLATLHPRRLTPTTNTFSNGQETPDNELRHQPKLRLFNKYTRLYLPSPPKNVYFTHNTQPTKTNFPHSETTESTRDNYISLLHHTSRIILECYTHVAYAASVPKTWINSSIEKVRYVDWVLARPMSEDGVGYEKRDIVVRDVELSEEVKWIYYVGMPCVYGIVFLIWWTLYPHSMS